MGYADMIRLTLLIPLVVLAGCASDQPIGKLNQPASYLMAPCQSAPTIHPGDDMINRDAELRAIHGRCSAKVIGLQKYVKAVTKG